MRRFYMKKQNFLFLLSLLLILLLCSCQKQQGTALSQDSKEPSDDSQSLFPSNDENPSLSEDGRIRVTLSVYSPDEATRQAVIAFNETNSDYYVELVFGFDVTDGPSINHISATDYWNQEMLDIFAGKGPDIFTKTLQSSYGEYVEKGVMEDLAPYIKRDLNPDDYLESSLYAYARDGKIYALESGFVLSLSVGNRKLLGDRKGWTFAEMQKIMQDNPQISIYENSSGGVGDFLQKYLTKGNPDYTDFDTLRSCIEFDKNHAKRLIHDEPIKPGENVMVTDVLLSNPLDWADYEALYGDCLTPVGFVDERNTGVFHDGFGWSINAASKQKEGAWAFLKFLLSEEYQRALDTSRFSPLKCLLEEQFDYYSTPLDGGYYDNKLQEMVYYQGHVLPAASQEHMRQNGYWKDIYIECLTPEQIQLVRDLIDRSRPISASIDTTLNNIILEEAGAYFKDSRSLDDVMQNIENRVTLYLEEQE